MTFCVQCEGALCLDGMSSFCVVFLRIGRLKCGRSLFDSMFMVSEITVSGGMVCSSLSCCRVFLRFSAT